MPQCHFLLIVIVIEIMLIYKEFFKNMKMRRMFLRNGLVIILIFCLFPKVIWCNTEGKNGCMVTKKYIDEYSLKENTYH